MATLRKCNGPRGRPVWQAQIIRQGFPPQYRMFDTKAEAEAWARRVESEMDSGSWLDRAEEDRTTLSDALDRYAKEISPRKAASTAKWDGHKIDSLKTHQIGKVALSRLTGKEVRGLHSMALSAECLSTHSPWRIEPVVQSVHSRQDDLGHALPG